ncbi:DNA recombination protein RmuC [Novosphingopyxis sp. YJ-S2-01]|uniref:DNA recombination protein RmuC n=1 Tax=Novosphingopyxis sp. YJ-S2-01 TaxID=2794021 RepID=UPI001E6412C8|nr:DNA recombination protein RmuC [Novosphingopyxis sp. YJ-S2-01]
MLAKRGGDDAKAAVELLRMQLESVARERDEAKAEMAAVRGEMQGLRDRAENDRSELASLKSGQEERNRAYEARIAELREVKELSEKALAAANEEARKALSAQFSEIGGKLLGEAQKNFLERADQRFHQQGERNEEKIRQLLAPVGERLKSYEEQVGKIEKERTEAYGTLTGLIGEMKEGQQRVQSEAAKLVNSLRNAPKSRGRWGEQQLKNVLETCGLAEHTDFVLEHSISTDDGRLRPDAVVRVPGGRSLVIDAKVSLNDYQDAFGADDETTREAYMARHCTSMKNHIDGLSRKAYWDQFEEAPDYVIMFVPGEHFLAAALEHQPDLWDYAFEKRVLLATPTNLVAIARTVASVWRQEGLAREAKQIGQLGKEMYDRLATAAEHLKRVGSGLNSAVGNYNKFVGSFERNVLSTGRRFRELNIDTGRKDIDQVDELEALPRYGEERSND